MVLDQLKFDEKGLIPVVVQDFYTKEVLTVAYMNRESLDITLREGKTCFWSRSRGELWRKGETSGHTQRVLEMRYDCDGDALLLTVEQEGPACHTGEISCFHNPILTADADDLPPTADVVQQVYDVICDRKAHPREGSYTNYLLDKGVEKICKKVGEEASETIIAAMKRSKPEVCYEAADLVYHLLVLLFEQGVTPDDLWAELARRR